MPLDKGDIDIPQKTLEKQREEKYKDQIKTDFRLIKIYNYDLGNGEKIKEDPEKLLARFMPFDKIMINCVYGEGYLLINDNPEKKIRFIAVQTIILDDIPVWSWHIVNSLITTLKVDICVFKKRSETKP